MTKNGTNDNTQRSIGRLEGKVDLVLGQITELKNAFNVLEAGRLSTLESQFANLQGRMTIIAAVSSILISVGFWFLNRIYT